MTVIKRPGERYTFTYEFADQLGAATISGTPVVVSTPQGGGANLVKVAQSVDGQNVLVAWEGGEDGETYVTSVTVTANDALGSRYEAGGPITVRALAGGSPLSVEQVKAQLQVISTDDDNLLEQLLAAAVDVVERYTGLILSRRSVIEHYDALTGEMRLRAWPIASIDAVTYRDRTNVAQLLDPTLYRLTGARPAYVLGIGAYPYAPAARGSVTVTLTAGYAEPNDVPATVMQALRLIVAEFYANREAGALSKDVERSVHWLLRFNRLKRV